MIGGGGFILKGGGWESDLYSGPSNRSKSTAPKSEPSSTTTTTTTDSKSTAKPKTSAKSDS